MLFFLQALKAKAITEGKIHGPRAKQQQIELEGPVEYEPFDFADGKSWEGTWEPSHDSGISDFTAI